MRFEKSVRHCGKPSRGEEDDKKVDEDVGDEKEAKVPEVVEFEPRDLDKHYEALRKTIHHVADGTDEPESVSVEQPNVPTALSETDTATLTTVLESSSLAPEPTADTILHLPLGLEDILPASPIAALEVAPNPWAEAVPSGLSTSAPANMGLGSRVVNSGEGEGDGGAGSGKAAADDLDRLMETLQADMTSSE